MTRPFFLKNVVLVQLSQKMGISVKADNVEFSLLNPKLTFKNARIDIADNQLIAAEGVSFNIDISELLKGNFKFNNIYLDSAHLNLIRDRDKKWNISINNGCNDKTDIVGSNSNLSFSNITINNCSINIAINEKTDSSVIELQNLNIKSPFLKSGVACPLEFNANISISSGKEVRLKEAFFESEMSVILNNSFVPTSVTAQLKINNIYGKLYNYDLTKLKVSLKSEVSLNNSTFEALNTVININETPFYSNLIFELNAKEHYPYSFSCKFEDLSLSPFFKSFLKNDFRHDSVIIKKFDMKLTGKNIQGIKNVNSSLNGYLVADISEISLPGAFTDYSIINIVFVPLDVFKMVRHLLPEGIGPQYLMSALDAIDKIFSNMNNVYFDKGRISLKVNNGVITLEEVFFRGKPEYLIEHMLFSGEVKADNQLKLHSRTNIGGLIIPIDIYGTHSKPKPNIKLSLMKFIKINALHILNPANVYLLLKDTGKSVENVAKKTYDTLEKDIENCL